MDVILVPCDKLTGQNEPFNLYLYLLSGVLVMNQEILMCFRADCDYGRPLAAWILCRPPM